MVDVKNIGRFRVKRLLGEGAQGQVFLAFDPRLDRQVAIKTLILDPTRRRDTSALLIQEARTVSKLSHPNIVTLYDAADDEDKPYLVFEYVEGDTLQKVLKEQPRLPKHRAVEIAIQILEGTAYAHEQGILHRDLKPGNIIFDDTGIARVMDFGIATTITGSPSDKGFAGTPLYVAPEYIQKREFYPASDIFAVSMTLYQMLTGRTAVDGASVAEILDRMVNDIYPPPSHWNKEVDEKLDSIVLRGIAKRPEDRFTSAQAMADSLRQYLDPNTQSASAIVAKTSTIDFLMRRMQHKAEFPALSESICSINRITASDKESLSTLSSVILKDFSLTNKLLKLVNAAIYGQFGKVSTISRAVVIVGFESVRNMAVSLMLFDHLQNKAQAMGLKEEIAGSLFSGVLAKELIGREFPGATEEAFICAVYQNLGKLLAAYYFHEEAQEIANLMEQKKLTEDQAVLKVLGLTYEELGIEIARTWNFPVRLLHTMQKVKDEKVERPRSEEERFRVIASLAGELRHITTKVAPKEMEQQLLALQERYGKSVTIDPKKLTEIADKALKEFSKEAVALGVDLRGTKLVQQANSWVAEARKTHKSLPDMDDGEQGFQATLNEADLGKTLILDQDGTELAGGSVGSASGQVNAAAVLAAGIQDITDTLVSQYKLNDLLRMIIETMYRAMGFSHVLIAIRDVKTNAIVGRFGLGDGVDELIKNFSIPLSPAQDLFYLALKQGRDLFITDSSAQNIQSLMPAWYKKHSNAPAFMLFPILVDKKPIGLFYADQFVKEKARIESREANLLVTLRNQAVLAFKQASSSK
jgi:serine/threonine protein kinase